MKYTHEVQAQAMEVLDAFCSSLRYTPKRHFHASANTAQRIKECTPRPKLAIPNLMSEQLPIVCKTLTKKKQKKKREKTNESDSDLPSQNYFADAQLQCSAQMIARTPRPTANLRSLLATPKT